MRLKSENIFIDAGRFDVGIVIVKSLTNENFVDIKTRVAYI